MKYKQHKRKNIKKAVLIAKHRKNELLKALYITNDDEKNIPIPVLYI